VTNPLEQPVCLDNICGRSFAFRANWQPLWDTLSVPALKEDTAFINKIIDLFPINEVIFSFCYFHNLRTR
jgi:hypothetical protein